jgi:hypothetical protein
MCKLYSLAECCGFAEVPTKADYANRLARFAKLQQIAIRCLKRPIEYIDKLRDVDGRRHRCLVFFIERFDIIVPLAYRDHDGELRAPKSGGSVRANCDRHG